MTPVIRAAATATGTSCIRGMRALARAQTVAIPTDDGVRFGVATRRLPTKSLLATAASSGRLEIGDLGQPPAHRQAVQCVLVEVVAPFAKRVVRGLRFWSTWSRAE
jgi:hypothetical protein